MQIYGPKFEVFCATTEAFYGSFPEFSASRGKALPNRATCKNFSVCEKRNDFRGEKWRFQPENSVVTFESVSYGKNGQIKTGTTAIPSGSMGFGCRVAATV